MAAKSLWPHKGKARTLADIRVGERFETGTALLDSDSVRRFAEAYDPQPLHLDEAAARETMLGELVASAWHVMSVAMKLIVEAAPFGGTPIIGMGMEQIRFHRPVLPETEICCRGEVREVRPSVSRPDRGYVLWHVEILDASSGDLLISQNWRLMLPSGAREGQ